MRSLTTAATGMLAQQLNVEVISNNVANVNTTGFKRQRAEFQDLLYQNERRVGTTSNDGGDTVPTGIQVGVGVKTAGVYKIMEQGNLAPTDNPLDVAINGDGFLQVQTDGGETVYTRAGALQLNQDGQMVTLEGLQVLPGITVPPEAIDVTINEDGEVLVSLDGQIEPQNVGQLELAIFSNEGGLEAIGGNLYRETAASGGAVTAVPGTDGYGVMLQGFLETANVNIVTEITSMITAQRAYEMNSKVMETSDQMMSTVTNIR